MKITLNLRAARTPQEIHDQLQSALAFPDYYGKNLDALHDMLTSWPYPAQFVLRLPESGDMAEYAQRLRRVFRDAARENGRIRVSG